MKKLNKLVIGAVVGATLVVAVTYGVLQLTKDSTKTVSSTPSVAKTADNPRTESEATATAEDKTKQQLLYLIEEEKLAHDVYTAMLQKYGANVFGNILESESTHQDRVLTLLNARNIADPRSSELGVFTNTDLQSLYNALIAQGNQNVSEAYKVGVAIEEKDILDITTQLATATDDDVIAALESLRKGSENHLRAFNRKL